MDEIYEIDTQTRTELMEMSRMIQEFQERIEWGLRMYRRAKGVPPEYILGADGMAFVPPLGAGLAGEEAENPLKLKEQRMGVNKRCR